MNQIVSDRYYIGGGVIAAVAGLSPFQTPLGAYHSIVGTAKELDEATAKFFRRRKALEPYVTQIISDDLGYEVIRQNERYTDKIVPYFKAEIDVEVMGAGIKRMGEIKTVSEFASKKWGEGDDDMPVYVLAQNQWGMGVTGEECGLVVGCVGFDRPLPYETKAMPDVIANLRARATSFWNDHVLPLVPPAPSTVEDVLEYVVPVTDAALVIDGDSELEDLVGQVRETNAARKAAEKAEDAAAAKLKILMAEKTIVMQGGKPVVTWKEQDTRRLDQGALKEKHPEIYEACCAVSKSRRFLVK